MRCDYRSMWRDVGFVVSWLIGIWFFMGGWGGDFDRMIYVLESNIEIGRV